MWRRGNGTRHGWMSRSISPTFLRFHCAVARINSEVPSLLLAQAFIRVRDRAAAVGPGFAVLVDADEDHLIDRENAFLGDLVAYFAGKGERRAAEMDRLDAQFDDIALAGRADEIDLGH